jgi:hypothetical protein
MANAISLVYGLVINKTIPYIGCKSSMLETIMCGGWDHKQ